MKKLTSKQELFCKEYLVDLNATQAAIRAGYSEKTARQGGSENLSKPYIQQRIKELMDKRAEKVEITAERVLEELVKIGFSNTSDFFSSFTGTKDWDEIPVEKKAAISEISNTVTEFDGGTKTRFSFKLHNKLDALEKISRHIGFFEKDNGQKKPDAPVVNLNGLDKEQLLALQAAKAALKNV